MWLMSVLCHINFRGENGGEVRYAEASMRNGFGLKYIHKFFNLPFIQLQVCLLVKLWLTHYKFYNIAN